MTITTEEAELIAERASKKALHEAMQKFGINPDEPIEMQKDMAHLRQQREASEQVGAWTKRALISAFVTGLITTVFIGIKTYLGQH
jgi:hypothetical protein